MVLLVRPFTAPKRPTMLSRSVGEPVQKFESGLADAPEDKQLTAPATRTKKSAPRSDVAAHFLA